MDDPEKDLKMRYQVRIPAYATRTGKRLLFEPQFFQRGETPLFPSATRRYAVAFQFAWRDNDAVNLEWPKGYVLESGSSIRPLKFGDVGRYLAGLESNGETRKLTCK